ncbi:glycosyltransferase family 2 protein [Sphingomonas sp. Leaf67]|uniref:glycosyltransferase family 2 protein n=1 Tax=Sphingomonas sp. Leaf67 TaxID=1736230 RepID=UPI000ADAF033|nr:glycosyltransferase family 2 protein [Sphingomonas sp. Leaf67]
MPPLAIITMVYNEAEKLPIWLRHYARQVGLAHCYVIDHGSDDGSTEALGGASRIALPRSPQDNDQRLALVADLTRGLLRYYRRVAYVDADELLLADPAGYRDLNDYAERMTADAVTSIGLEIVHGTGEPPLESTRGVGGQRGSVIFSSSMCKTNMIGRGVNWAPGWHAHDAAPRFDDLYLFHLRHADLDQALRRLAITRAMPWASEAAGRHQRNDDDWMRGVVSHFGGLPFDVETGVTQPDGPVAQALQAFVADATPGATPAHPWSVPLARYGRPRVAIEPRFRKALDA